MYKIKNLIILCYYSDNFLLLLYNKYGLID